MWDNKILAGKVCVDSFCIINNAKSYAIIHLHKVMNAGSHARLRPLYINSIIENF